MPGTSAAVQSSRWGSRPKLPDRVGATMRTTASQAANILNGRRILSCMSDGGLLRGYLRRRERRDGLGGVVALGLVDRTDHIQRSLRAVLELIAQDALAAVERVLQADGFSGHATELLGGEKWL